VLQLIAILAMDPPVGEDVEAVRDEKARLLKAIVPLDPEHLVRGQFRGYRDEPGVAPISTVETFAALHLRIDNWRWADVPFFVRAGKSLAADAVEVRAQLKRPPRYFYRGSVPSPGYLRFRIGPDVTALAIGMQIKRKGEAMVGREVELLASEDQAHDMLTYQRLLGDAMRGDASLFARKDAIEAQWRVVEPVLDLRTPPPLPYEPGTWGPAEADRLVAGVPGGWHKPVDTRRSS
jgi:glucose-6-phosphate 1-dehydrogenase